MFAQNSSPIDKERYDFLYDSLSTEKNNLLIEKAKLISSIDSLKNYLSELEIKSESSRALQLKRKYGSEIGNRVALGQVWKGMSEKMLEDSWGKPDKITKNKEKWGTFTQWYYGEITYFFKDGIMTDWEEKK
ncbi:MAG: hypothetical protein OQJ81_06325 [Melioribacteraceae bacterium]|nr:hypothetical protein [Melioribacteraceae bacterium]